MEVLEILDRCANPENPDKWHSKKEKGQGYSWPFNIILRNLEFHSYSCPITYIAHIKFCDTLSMNI